MSLTPGSRLGPYEIVSSLGAGGMGEVYRAHDPRLGRDVALKILPAALSSDPESLERFTREARAVAALNNPHIVTLHSTEEADGVRFMTMELIEGQTLDRMIPPRGVSLPRFFEVSTGMAAALSAAHQKGITHRDLKPLNVMMTNSGQVKVLDFGLARNGGPGPAPGESVEDESTRERLTQAGMVVGTAPYMSPEQVEGRPLDGRSDIFSLGIVMYQMITGTRPFRGDTSPSLMASILRDHPRPVRDLRADMPDGVIRLIERCLEKSPRDRVQSAQEVLIELKALRRAWESDPAQGRSADASVNPTVLMEASSAAHFSRSRVALIAALLVVAASVGWWAVRGRKPNADRPSTSDRKQDTSIGVLPFAELNADQNAYLGAGVAETISTALSKVPGLSITVRSQASTPHDAAAGLREIGRQLGVANILTGSIQRAGGQLRIAARLVRAESEEILWSNVFDRPASDIFAVQDEVARNVAQALQLTLNTGAAAAPVGGTRNTEAYDAYLLGRYHWNRRTTDGMIQATAAFKKAIELDPNYAQAWSGLADAYSLSIPTEYDVPGLDPKEALRLAEEAARKAIALAPGLGEAHVSLGMALSLSGRSGMEALERAVALSPSYATGHQFYSYELSGMGRWEEARREMEMAHRLDPLSHVITLSLAVGYDALDRFADASPLYAQGLAQSPEAWYGWVMKFAHDLALRQLDDAAVSLRNGLKGFGFTIVTPEERSRMIRLADLWATSATREKATDAIIRTGEPFQALALARWQRGDEAVIETLTAMVRDNRAKDRFQSSSFYAILGPRLRADPRVQALTRQLGLPPG